jgi:hypothetical protein
MALITAAPVRAQVFLNDLMDTSSTLSKGFLSLYQQYNWLRFSGYLQPQFQRAESEGASSFNGGDFPAGVDNRFSLRRGRLRIDYLRRTGDGYPVTQLVFQFDGTERGFFARDYWGRAFENKWHIFSVTGGMFARPFGYEVNLGSGDRESPERGRASQLLMRVERDLGGMLTIEPRKIGGKFRWLRADLAVVNGQGLTATADYDSHKDVIGRINVKPLAINRKKWLLSGGISAFEGGVVSNNAIIYNSSDGGNFRDSSASNIGRLMHRRYHGADAQLKIPNRAGFTEFRAEVLGGDQTGFLNSSETPVALGAGLTTRKFTAAYFYFLQHLGNIHHQAVVKYDWYDPNARLKGDALGSAKGNTGADVRYNTLGIGYLWSPNSNMRLMLFYDIVRNEKTQITGYTNDLKDDVLTARLQFRF